MPFRKIKINEAAIRNGAPVKKRSENPKMSFSKESSLKLQVL